MADGYGDLMQKMVVAAVAVIVLAVVSLFAFRPWSSGGDTQEAIDEALPTPVGAAAVPGEQEPSATPAPTPQAPATSAEPEPAPAPAEKSDEPTTEASAPKPTKAPQPQITELASGQFEDAEYDTNGTARIVELTDGSRFLRIENFSTSQAPVIQVAFSNAPSGGAWGSYDDVRFAPIGTLKALSGNQNYEIPAGLDLGGFNSVVIWCDKYDVALGTAPVQL